MKGVLIVVASLVASVAAGDWGQSCTDETLDAAAGILTATCDAGEGSTTRSSVNLNDCLGYDKGKISVRPSARVLVERLLIKY